MTTYEGALRCARANMTRAAHLLEKAKDNPGEYERWYGLALRAEMLAREWETEAVRLKA